MKTVHAMITGRVQGVGYRYWTVQQAQSLSLTGWVRNRSDGAVEAVFHGDNGSVDAMIEACRRGPRSARVIAVDISAHPFGGWTGFETRPTA